MQSVRPWCALPARIQLHVSPTQADAFASRGVFPSLTPGHHCLTKGLAVALYDDATAVRLRAQHTLSRAHKLANTALLKNLTRALGISWYELRLVDEANFASDEQLAYIGPFVNARLQSITRKHA